MTACIIHLLEKKKTTCMNMSRRANIDPELSDVETQAGGSDCGVFALAFATVICFGHVPGKFNQQLQNKESKV